MNYSLKSVKHACVCAVCFLLTTTAAFAGGPAGTGSDSWTSYLERNNRFTPHDNYCDSSEVFIVTTPEGTGFCMEKNERTSTTWLAARQACIDLGKRLPESAEFQHACHLDVSPGTALNDMTDDWEWVSNYSTLLVQAGTSNVYLMGMIGGGASTSCDSVGIGFIGSSPTVLSTSAVYRCVR